MKKSTKYISMLAGGLMLSGAFAGCTDELLAPSGADSSIYEVADDEYGLGVVLSLDQLTSVGSRGQIGGPLGNLAGGTGEGLKDIEEYVNTENLYILFFNLDGTFLFQIDKPTAVPIGQSELGNDNQWFVRIPVKDINENLIKYIEDNPFKIAVLANWTFDSDLNLGGNLSGWEEFRFQEPLDAEGNLTYDEFGKLKGDHISLLAHAQRDNVYENTTLHGYDHLVYRTETGPHMGPYTEWVANYHKSIDQADADIRNYFDVKNNIYQNPGSFFFDANGIATALDHFDTKYNNIWHVWNFGGDDDSQFIFTMPNAQIKADWLALNKKGKEDYLENYAYYYSRMLDSYSLLTANQINAKLSSKTKVSTKADVPVVVPVPAPGAGSKVISFKWQMGNYSDLDLVMPDYERYLPIVPNTIFSTPGLRYSDFQATLLRKAFATMLQDSEFAEKFPDLLEIDFDSLSYGELIDILYELDYSMTQAEWDEYERIIEQFYQENIADYLAKLEKAITSFNGFVITWPNITMKDNTAGNPLNLDGYTNLNENTFYPVTSPTYIKFPAHADGYVRVLYKTSGGAKLMAHVGTNNTPENNASNYQRDNKTNRYEVNEDGYFVKSEGGDKQICDIPFDAKDVYLYMVVDPDYQAEEADESIPYVEIYGIEYIESRHLYDVDRRAVLPSKDYAIPMYGVQDFDPIGEYWEPGLLFNLSQFNNATKLGYNYRNISLLRSVARVEVKLSKAAFPQKPSHVYMRSMNRSGRNTPVDFFTPTDIVWNGFNSSSSNDVKRLQNYIDVGNLNEQRIIQNTPGVVQEEKNIMQYGPIYIGTGGTNGQSTQQKLTEYRKTTAWPFGIWEHQWDWDWNRGNGIVEDFETYQVGDIRAHTGQQVPEYPRILHPRISRSDYSHFAEVDDPDYWHYIIYIPEKNITDADEPGDIADRPKIIHVELRFNGGPDDGDTSNDEDNIVDNFDDKRAYRLYFTEGGRANLGNFQWNGRDSWDAYEYDWNIAKQHWPILRNHVYTFTVNGAPDHVGSVDFRVDAPERRGAYYEFY